MPNHHSPTSPLTRRRFLETLVLAAAGAAAARCAPAGSPTRLPESPTPAPSAPTLAPSATGTPSLPPTATSTPLPTSTATPLPPTFTPTPAYKALVGIEKAASYEPAAVRKALQALLDETGGLEKIVKPGARVAIKVNLTGGAVWAGANALPPTEVFMTHPEVVKALCEFLRDAGASKIYIVEGIVEAESYQVFGYTEAAKATGAELVDLNWKAPFKNFTQVSSGTAPLVYETFTFNPALVEIDAFISVAKLKCHYTAGVTLALKNLIGIGPLGFYRREASQTYRSAMHGGFENGIDQRLIRVILDLNRARPIHYALIDGIWTCEGGEGAWQKTMQQVKPGLLIGGADPVAVDSVGTAVMGFDPAAADRAAPFIRSENYLRMAGELGLGANNLDEIGVLGAKIEDVQMSFRTTD
jgi:uncharacterized protein (DUF362 family)